MKELDSLVKCLENKPDQLLVGWVFYGSDYDGYYLINKTFLTVAGIFDGEPKGFRLPGSVVYDNMEDYINYNGSTVRIIDGPRKGVLLDISQIREDEEVSRVGLMKQLRRGRQAHLISNNRAGDANFIRCLHGFTKEAEEGSDKIYMPQVYISATPDQERNLRLRRNCSIVRDKLHALNGIVPGKVLHSYNTHYGHGVVVAYGLDNIPAQWISKDALDASTTSAVRINLIDYMKGF